MRILYIHQFFATRESDLGLIRSYEFARRMVEAGHQVTMITSSSRLPEQFQRRVFVRAEVDGIDVRSVRVRYSNQMPYARRILSFLLFTAGAKWLGITAPRPDVVLATSTPLTVGVPGLIAAWVHGAPFVFEVRDLWPEAAIQMGALKRGGPLATLAKALERFLYRRAAAVIALSPGMVAGVIAEGTDPARVHMVPNCSDIDLFHPGPRDAKLVRRFHLAHKFVVAYAGAIGPSNGLEHQVPQAAKLLQGRGRDDIVFLIAGDGKSLPLLREAKERDSLDNLVLAGSMPKAEVPALTRTADVLMTLFADVPILATNSPNKFFDALASGVPVIVNQPGWTKDLVEENDAGVAVPAADPFALADAIERLSDDRAAVKRMGRNARVLAERRFSRDEMAAEVIRILEDVVTEAKVR
ncbi:MAG: glycosyltransferase WbuB [Coriobacteriaceae bacterium]|nr:glycosyltransferase WbuB [Coriobacteriaceae bacterium]